MYHVVLLFSLLFLNLTPLYAMTEDSVETVHEFLHPVTKFRFNKKIEPILDYKDDQGFGPINVRINHVKSKYWNMEFNTYHYQLKNLFSYELDGHKTHIGIHFPPITRFYQVTVHYNDQEIMVKLSDDSFKTIDILGTVSLKDKGWDLSEGIKFCSDFLYHYVLFDHLYFRFYGKDQIPTNKVSNAPYWTIIDDYILSQTVNVKEIPDTLDNSPNTEVVRQIGDFFKWRNIVINFIHELPPKFMNEIQISRMFKRYLIDQIHLEEKMAHQYSKMMNLENAQIIMLMSSLNPDNTDHLNLIFDQLVKRELIKEEMKKPYMEVFTG